MSDYFQNFGVYDIMGLVLVSIGTGLGFATDILTLIIPFGFPNLIIAGIAILSVALGTIMLAEGLSIVADETDPSAVDDGEIIPERWHRKIVDRAYSEGYAEGHSDGFREGIDKGTNMARQMEDINRKQKSQRRQRGTGVSSQKDPSEDQSEHDGPERESEEEVE